MTCRAPLQASQHKTGGKVTIWKTGTRPKTLAEGYAALDVPCGQCMSCRLEKQRIWAIRMAHEAQFWEEALCKYSIFLTLTYDDEHLPLHKTLVKDHVQGFFKRLWWKVESDKLRYYVVGEYGAQCPDHEIENCPLCGPLQRPHYHAIIFGWDAPPKDQKRLGTRDGMPVYESQIINEAWTFGKHEYGACTFEACSYVAGYLTKKQTGNEAPEYYTRHIIETDQIVEIEPEFAMMSKRPGIGKYYYDAYHAHMYNQDQCTVPGRGEVGKPPPYYDAHYEEFDSEHMARIKEDRRKQMAESLAYGPSLESRAIVQDARLARRSRK